MEEKDRTDAGGGSILCGESEESKEDKSKWWGKFSDGFKRVSNKEPQLLVRAIKDNAS